jgi:phospholipid N-methyltransferase
MTETLRGTATYSPDDNKLRFYPLHRLSAEDYGTIRAAGFIWAGKQELFVAPTWTPGREDLLLSWCGEIDDEDKSLVERAGDRAERFDGYSDKRAADARAARDAVSAIADNIPLGQPILVGHHSEKRARKDAERIRSGMDKAVKMWRTSQYWTARAAGAIHHAKYKELPAVRARRIKTIEADKRRCERELAKRQSAQKIYSDPAVFDAQRNGKPLLPQLLGAWGTGYGLSHDDFRAFEKGELSAADAVAGKRKSLAALIEHYSRWIEHHDNRLAYERAMLEEQGATKLLEPKPRKALAPMLNYKPECGYIEAANPYHRGEVIKYRVVEGTKAQYAKVPNDYKGGKLALDKSHRFRIAHGGYFGGEPGKHEYVAVFLTDSKAHPVPEAKAAPERDPAADMLKKCEEVAAHPVVERKAEDPEAADFDAMARTLRAGVQVVSAPQLFPTGDSLAERMAGLAGIEDGDEILEPSAGTGALLRAIRACNAAIGGTVAVEINHGLAAQLERGGLAGKVINVDFLSLSPETVGRFDRIVMNPPFAGGADIKHIKHAVTFLKPGGRLVAICANGPRQQEALTDLATHWEQLPAGSFASSGTLVNTALLVIDA